MALPGNRKRGRPRRKWSDNINEDMENIGVVREDTQDRKKVEEINNPSDSAMI